MNIKQLIKMANQIESFYRSDPNPEDAIKGIQSHIQRFWDPRMRQQIRAHVEQGAEGVGDLAIQAVTRLAPISPKWEGRAPKAA